VRPWIANTIFAVGGGVLGVLLSCTAPAHATVYDPQQAKGFPRLRDSDSVLVPLASFYENGLVTLDEVRMPKPPKDSDIGYRVCVRMSPSSIAQCVVTMKTLGITFAIEVPLNLREV
jgi:hypothetical protein